MCYSAMVDQDLKSLPHSTVEAIEPQLLNMGDQALILRGYERLVNDDGAFTAVQG